jgi:hypothetical protein
MVDFGAKQEGIPQGLKPPFFEVSVEKPKAEALGYLEAKATAVEFAQSRLFREDNKKDNRNATTTATAKCGVPVRLRSGQAPLRHSR